MLFGTSYCTAGPGGEARLSEARAEVRETPSPRSPVAVQLADLSREVEALTTPRQAEGGAGETLRYGFSLASGATPLADGSVSPASPGERRVRSGHHRHQKRVLAKHGLETTDAVRAVPCALSSAEMSDLSGSWVAHGHARTSDGLMVEVHPTKVKEMLISQHRLNGRLANGGSTPSQHPNGKTILLDLSLQKMMRKMTLRTCSQSLVSERQSDTQSSITIHS